MNRKVKSCCFHCENQDRWVAGFTILVEEQQGKIHTNICTVKYCVNKEGDTTGVSFFKNH